MRARDFQLARYKHDHGKVCQWQNAMATRTQRDSEEDGLQNMPRWLMVEDELRTHMIE